MYSYQKWLFIFEFTMILSYARTPLEMAIIAIDDIDESLLIQAKLYIH